MRRRPPDLDDLDRPRRFNLLLLATFAVVALVLVALGIYGVVAYSVAERTHEISIRAALGAERSSLVGMIVRQTMASVALGIGAGLAAAVLATELLQDCCMASNRQIRGPLLSRHLRSLRSRSSPLWHRR